MALQLACSVYAANLAAGTDHQMIGPYGFLLSAHRTRQKPGAHGCIRPGTPAYRANTGAGWLRHRHWGSDLQ